MTPTDLDTLIAKLKAPDAVAVQDIEPKVLAAGLEDLRNRMSHLEHSHLKVLANSRDKDDRLTKLETVSGTLEHDRDEMRKTVSTATDLPIANQKKLVELEARVRVAEGAVGVAPYKPPTAVEPATSTAVGGKTPVPGFAQPRAYDPTNPVPA